MNSKKHKGKNRAKAHPLPTPKQDISEDNAKNEEILPEIKTEKKEKECEEIKQEEIKQEVIEVLKEKSTELPKESIIEDSTEESPIKPKRNKGKKKKLNIAVESDQEVKVDNTKQVEVIQNVEVIDLVPDASSQEFLEVQPTTRKKKNKGKKRTDSTNEATLENKSDNEVSVPEDQCEIKNIENKIQEDIKPDISVPNKKNKKKKRRYDSEKSEKAEEQMSCTLAFKELIDTEKDENELNKTQNVLEEVKEAVIVCPEKYDPTSTVLETTEQEWSKNENTKKKKKKDKKHPAELKDDSALSANVKNLNLEKSDDIKTVKQDNTTKAPAVKQQKEEHVLPKSISMESVSKKIPTRTHSPIAIVNVEILDVSNKDVVATVAKDTSLGDMSVKQDKDFSELANVCESVTQVEKCKEDISVEQSKEMKREQNDSSTGSIQNITETDDFVSQLNIIEDQSVDRQCCAKSTSLSDKLPEITLKDKEIPTTGSDITGLVDDITSPDMHVHEETEKKSETKIKDSVDNTPDFIDIPRSSSQQLLDNNNNKTVIKEITTPNELKLGIPILTSSMIQGSGETPVSTPKDNLAGISVTEIASIPNKEKNDLKTKMMEVNQDLEGLRKSLEKSLAEFNVLEKSEQSIIDIKPEEKTISIVEEIDQQPLPTSDEGDNYKPLADRLNEIEKRFTPPGDKISEDPLNSQSQIEQLATSSHCETPPVCPSRKDRKHTNKSKKKGHKEPETVTTQTTTSEGKQNFPTDKKSDEKTENSKDKGKEQSQKSDKKGNQHTTELQYEPIENFEDALSSSVDDVDINKTFEIIASELNKESQNDAQQTESAHTYPEINITPPLEDAEKEKQPKNSNPVSQPKNLLGRPNIPVPSNRTDYKKEKNKTPNFRQAKVKIKDSVDIEKAQDSDKVCKQSQTEDDLKLSKDKNKIESFSFVTNEKEEYVYKYNFRRVFINSVCHICRKDLKQSRLPCKFCNLVFYCGQKHKDEDWPRHQNLCFAVSTIVHLKDQKHIYADAKNISGQNYRLIRMQMILSCEKVLKRKLLPWEQEALLYPRICADVQCREWRQSKLSDCEACGQISFCIENPDHLPLSHQRWCKSYALYQKLVLYQQTFGRLEPKMPRMVMTEGFIIPDKVNEVLASMYEEKIDMSDIQYAALTQVATAPLTTAYCYQIYRQKINCFNGICKKPHFTVHVVGAELQYEADSLNKWEVFLLHLKPDVKDLRVALIGADLNPSNLPLHLLGKIKPCENCRASKRRVQFSFQDKMSYRDYWASDDFIVPDIVCAFNPSMQRSSTYHGIEPWSSTINCVLKQKVPFVITSYTVEELSRDIECLKSCAEVEFKMISSPKQNPFGSVRPDRNFITDDETPLLFKNYCFTVLCGA